MSDAEGWHVELTATANRSLHRMPAKAAVACLEFCFGVLSRDPHRLGKPLLRELTDHWVARRGPYRIVYVIDADSRKISLLRIEHRADVYRSR